MIPPYLKNRVNVLGSRMINPTSQATNGIQNQVKISDISTTSYIVTTAKIHNKIK